MGKDRDEMSPEEKIAWQKKAMKSRNNPVLFKNDSFTKGEIDRARENG